MNSCCQHAAAACSCDAQARHRSCVRLLRLTGCSLNSSPELLALPSAPAQSAGMSPAL